jgi:DDB1- and CUL4-associated factor 11
MAAAWTGEVRRPDFDYRYRALRRERLSRRHPDDHALRTFTGHSVQATLIRCNFSPADSSGGAFVYTGSADGRALVYDMATGRMVRALDQHSDIVRDVAWHPTAPLIVTSSWDGTNNRYEYRAEANSAAAADDSKRSAARTAAEADR